MDFDDTFVKKLVPVEKAVGMVLPHDITEIVPGKKKGCAFKKGHIIKEEDIPRLKNLGKFNIYCLELGPDHVHENEAGITLGKLACGEGVETDLKVSEGKVNFKSKLDGLFKVDEDLLYEINLLGDIIISTRHSNSVVKKGESVAAGRAIPLVISRKILNKAVEILKDANGLLRVLPFKIQKAAILVTGREVYEGLVEDAFGPAMTKKLEAYSIEVISLKKVPDDIKLISDGIKDAIVKGAQLVLCTGGMSVDPDDVTRKGISRAGATSITYGSPVLPGAMFLVSYLNGIPILGIPACGMYFKTTVLDIVLPRILAGEKIGREEIAALGHGGLCLCCKKCNYPICPFGK